MQTVFRAAWDDSENRMYPVEDFMRTFTHPSDILPLIEGCLQGLRLGDGLGSEWEWYTPAEILEATMGRGVMDFSHPTKRRPDAPVELCAPTDDTQLSFALARAIIRSTELDLVEVARELVSEFRANRFGWGGTTKDAAHSFGEWFDSDGTEGRDPRTPCPPAGRSDRGCGTGVAMKIAPLALWHFVRSIKHPDHPVDLEALLKETMLVGAMTHSDPRASHAAAAISAMLLLGITSGGSALRDEPKRTLASLTELIGWLESTTLEEADRGSENTMTNRLHKAAEALTVDASALPTIFPNTFHALDAVGLVIAIVLRHPNDYRAAVLEAVNCGGDADTVACMVGAIIGACVGLEGIPEAWRARVHPTHLEASNLSAEMLAAA